MNDNGRVLISTPKFVADSERRQSMRLPRGRKPKIRTEDLVVDEPTEDLVVDQHPRNTQGDQDSEFDESMFNGDQFSADAWDIFVLDQG
jgi:hypothetical protein